MSASTQGSSGSDDCRKLRFRVEELERENAELSARVEAVDRERLEYLQNVAHQIVSPLNAIKWHIENITHNRISAERAQKVLRSIYSQSTIAVHLAKNFALMSNLEADHALKALQEPLEPIELSRLLVNLADDFQPLGWANAISIEVDVPSFRDVPDVLAIKPLISQAFSNIIENAIKYSTPDSQITITGSYSPELDEVSVHVSNRGIAIGPDEVLLVFERGYRGSAARSAYPAGTGFGLYIAKKIVEIHEGQIETRPEQGRTVFTVRLPVRQLEGKARQWPKKRSS